MNLRIGPKYIPHFAMFDLIHPIRIFPESPSNDPSEHPCKVLIPLCASRPRSLVNPITSQAKQLIPLAELLLR